MCTDIQNYKYGNEFLLGCLFFVWAVMAWFWTMHELPEWMPDISYIPNSLLQYIYLWYNSFACYSFFDGDFSKDIE